MDRDTSLVSFDPAPALRVVRFVRRALRRHWLIATVVPLVFTAVAVTAAIVLPRKYSADTRLLTKKNFTMAEIVAPRRAVPTGAEAPAQSATELALQHDALLQIVRQAHLVERWKVTKSPLAKLKEKLLAKVQRPRSQADIEEDLVGILRARLTAGVVDDEVIKITVTWWTAEDVPVILREALNAFLAARQHLDVESIGAAVDILTRSIAAQEPLVQQRLAAFGSARAQAAGLNQKAPPVRVPAELEVLRLKILATRHTLETMEHQRNLRIGDQQMRLAEASATLGNRNPDLIAERAALARLNEDDGGVSQVLVQERELKHQYVTSGGSLSELNGVTNNRDFVDAPSNPDDDAQVIYARGRLRTAVDDYQDLVSRLTNARIELEAARAAFAYRFIVTLPPELPRKPVSPKVPMVILGGIVAGLVAGAAAASARELRRRRPTGSTPVLVAA